MLHSFCHRKSNLYRRYLGHREEGEKRVCEEDEITSLIMGPLDYLSDQARALLWKALVEHGSTTERAFPSGPIRSAEMKFWPRKSIEPDLLVQLEWETGERRIILVEFKWRAPLSGDDQLHRQWSEFLTADERDVAYHLFIAPDISAGLNALGRENVWQGKLVLRSWLDVLNVLSEMDCSTDIGLSKWRFHVTDFLGRLGIERFQGFRGLYLPVLPECAQLFWRKDGLDEQGSPVPHESSLQLASITRSSSQ